jgi:putative ABC transport system ATP-binding protein
VSTAPVVSAQSVHKSFGGKRGVPFVSVLNGISFQIPRGKMVSIVGPSGCGKSTLLFALAGLDTVTEGAVALFGTDLASLKATALATLYRDRIGFVFQSYNLVSSLSARENVVLPQRLAGKRVELAAADEVLAELGLAERTRTNSAQLSNGEQQRVALARVLANAPELVFADEPTGALDSVTSALVLQKLRHHADGEHTVVMVTHDLEAARLADVVLVMRDGRLTHTLSQPSNTDILAALSETAA